MIFVFLYGLRLPQSERLIRKSARLLASSEDMKQLAKLGPEKMILSMHVTTLFKGAPQEFQV